MKKKAAIGLVAALCLGSSMTAFAAPEVMPDGGIFDAEYYAEHNPDVVAAYGMDKDAMYLHYVVFGASEGRLPFADDAQVQQDVQTEEELPVEGVLGAFGAEYQLPTWSTFEGYGDGDDGIKTMSVTTTVDPDWLASHIEQLAPYTVEGYEWRPMQLIISGAYNEEQGVWWPYYNYRFLAQHSDDWEMVTDDGIFSMYRFQVTQDGADYTECRFALFSDQIGDVNTMQSVCFLVPKNYTGNLIYIVRAMKPQDGDIVVDETNAVTYVF